MKRLISPLFVVLAYASIVWASTPSNTTVQDIRVLSQNQAEQQRPVRFEATVTNFRPQEHYLFVQDGDAGIFVDAANAPELAPGDRVQIEGTTTWGYRTDVVSNKITVLRHGSLPKPASANFEQLIRGQFDARLVTVRGSVQSADLRISQESGPPIAKLKVRTSGGYFEAEAQIDDAIALTHLLDAEVAITGVAGGRFDGKMQLTGILIHVNSLADIRVIKLAKVNPWSLPITDVGEILRFSNVEYKSNRVRVVGTVTYFEPGSALVLQNGEKGIWIKTGSYAPLRIGNRAQAIGFPAVESGFLVLTDSEVLDSGVAAPIQPDLVNSKDLRSSKHTNNLVSIEGKVLMQARERSEDQYVVLADGQMFSIVYPHRGPKNSLPPFRDIPAGSKIRVTGICITEDGNPFSRDVPFNIMIRSADDIEIVAPPSLLTVRNLALLVMGLLLAVLAVGARALWTGRRMRSQMAQLGYLSQRRGEILEDINRSQPLLKILERITELVSMSLKGAPCWCSVGDGPTVGNRPDHLDATGLRTVEIPIAAHSGNNLGSIYAAFDARTKPRNDESKALEAAALLATLAVETSRMHSDLVHRSEFDMLTEVQNRFAFEKRLQILIDEARRSAGSFGLIYIDLNEFKQVNDHYGHQAGDLYLQKVAERMKHQLRSCDMLARLGGDEFGVLVPILRGRSDAEDIAHRLECCFDQPFTINNHIVRGSASIGIALYPADGLTEDALMSVADAAMYEKKRLKHDPDKVHAGQES